MKTNAHRSILSGFVLTSMLAGCGWYTNIPAQITIKSIDPSSVTIEYNVTTVNGVSSTTVKYAQPVISLQGQPGSIGVTYTLLTVKYLLPKDADPKKNPLVPDINSGQPIYSTTAVRVESSAMKEDYQNGNLDLVGMEPNAPTNDQKKLMIGIAKFTAPVISQDVIKLGSPSNASRPGQIFAEIQLDGFDDAHFNSTIKADVPIVFADATLK